MLNDTYDKIILGAGIYGLYGALLCADKGQKVLVLEYDETAFSRASYVNQARIHNGYHYPRSLATAWKCKEYFAPFNKEFAFCINDKFTNIYAMAKNFSWTNDAEFRKFCAQAKIKCLDTDEMSYFKPRVCQGIFDTQEYVYDAGLLKQYFLKELSKRQIEIVYEARIKSIKELKEEQKYKIILENGQEMRAPYLLNTTYAAINQIIKMLGFETIKIKYELCEVILCKVSKKYEQIGITVLDGPFFSIIPFGKTGLHSLTSVISTPHQVCYSELPTFDCQKKHATCSPQQLANCNSCLYKPQSAYAYLKAQANKYVNDDMEIEYVESLFSVKPILMASEVDDSRPTIIKEFRTKPTFVSVLSGKINTIYDLKKVL
jgi:hypothetical protein